MKRLFFVVFLTLCVYWSCSTDFLSEQKNQPRVKAAYSEKENIINTKLHEKGLTLSDLHIIIAAYKAEKELDIFVKGKTDIKFKKLCSYTICKTSGNLGPKNKFGDLQTPEGFYSIDRFNPSSLYHLSLGINYPNQVDRLRSNASNLGGDIFIHGKCMTIGCLPMTDDGINEIYLYAINAKQNGQKDIPVYIFPYRFTDSNCQIYTEAYKQHPELIMFWKDLKTGYDKFNKNMEQLSIKAGNKGNYEVN